MALTQDQWFEKLKSILPKWFVRRSLSESYLQSLAKVLRDQELQGENVQIETFITQASGSVLDLHGSERSVTRISGEADEDYAERIQNVYDEKRTAHDSLFEAIKSVLNNDEPLLIENMSHGFFGDDFFIGDDAAYLVSRRRSYNRVSVIIPPQTGGDHDDIKAAIVEAIEQNRAAGVIYDILYQQ